MSNPPNPTITSFWLGKAAFVFISLLCLAGAAVAVVPVAIEALATALLSLWTAANPWLSPPFLFITVHLIILLIWKLSDEVQSHHQQAAKVAPLDPSSSPVAPPLHKKPSPDRRAKIPPFSVPPVFEHHKKAVPLKSSVSSPMRGDPTAELLSRTPSSPTSPLYYNHVKAAPLVEKRSKSKSPQFPESTVRANRTKASPFELSPSLDVGTQIPSFPTSSLHYDRVKAAPLVERRSKTKSPRSPESPPVRAKHIKASPFDLSSPLPLQRQPSMHIKTRIPPSSPVHVKMAPLDRPVFELQSESTEVELEEMEIKLVRANWKPITPGVAVAGEEDSDELNRRFDEFIKERYDQMRLESIIRRRSTSAATDQQ